MSAWPDADGAIIERYLKHLRLRCPIGPTYYRGTLRSFQEVASRQPDPVCITRATLDAWLQDRGRIWVRSTVMHRARIVTRFLGYLTREGLAVGNPIAELRAQYHARSDAAVLNALLSSDPEQAFEALRGIPAFGGPLGGLMRDHIALMQARGYRYEAQARWLWRFDRFLQRHPELAAELVPVMLRHWASERQTANHAAECEKLARILGRALRRLDPAIQPRRPDPRPDREVAKQWRRPYIYSGEEVERLLEIARTYPSPRARLRPASLHVMLILAYCCGLRLGEIARLDLGDFDPATGTIAIRETKFFKSRILPLADSTQAALTDYLELRREANAPQGPADARRCRPPMPGLFPRV